MRFEFKPSEHRKSFKEYLKYASNISLVTDIYKRCIIIPVAIIIFAVVLSLLKGIYRNTLFYSIVYVIGVILVVLFVTVVALVSKLFKKKIKNNKMYCDLESKFRFIVEEGHIIRENDFSTIKIAIKSIEKIKLLKHGVIICAEGEKVDMFIPTDILPISINELINLVRYENSRVVIDETAKKEKKRLGRYYLILLIASLVAAVSSYFIDKYDYEHNFTKYDLVIQDNHKLFYENNNLELRNLMIE